MSPVDFSRTGAKGLMNSIDVAGIDNEFTCEAQAFGKGNICG